MIPQHEEHYCIATLYFDTEAELVEWLTDNYKKSELYIYKLESLQFKVETKVTLIEPLPQQPIPRDDFGYVVYCKTPNCHKIAHRDGYCHIHTASINCDREQPPT
jgi:hypothetical protein